MKRILVIDDEEPIRKLAMRVLKQEGYEVDAAANGQIAIKSFKAHPSDLVITDIMMPDMDGLEVIQELRRLQPDLKIIAMSGGGTMKAELALKLAKGFGAGRMLSKPFGIDELTDAVKEVLSEV